MSKAGYRESTIRSTVAALKAIGKRTDLLDAEQAKVYLANALYLVAVNKNPALGPSISVEYSIKISWSERSYAQVLGGLVLGMIFSGLGFVLVMFSAVIKFVLKR